MFKMFRYLNKYVGTYRVKAAYDLDLEDFPRGDNGDILETFDDLYIPCKKGVIKHTYREERGKAILYWYTESPQKGRNVYKEITDKYKDIWLEVEDIGPCDYIIYFDDIDFEKIASIVKPSTNGAKIKPYSEKNLPKTVYEIPEGDLKKFDELFNNMSKVDKMLFLKKIFTDFDEVIQKKKGKRFNIEKKRKESKLNKKQFIHSIGMWNELLEYIKECK